MAGWPRRRHSATCCALERTLAGQPAGEDRLRGDADFQSICAINAVFDCDRVVSSPHGSLDGIPLAWFAAWFYALFTLAGLSVWLGTPTIIFENG